MDSQSAGKVLRMESKTENINKIAVMTGGTSGIGAVAARIISGTQDTLLMLGARNPKSSPRGKIQMFPLDLSRLESVRAFAKSVCDALGQRQIDTLILNAGTEFSNLEQRTADGFEMTFGVNYLAHYLLLQLLMPKLAPKARVIITTSDTHARVKKLDPELLAHPHLDGRKTGFSDGFGAYAASKLCDLLMAKGLSVTRFAKERGLVVVAYNPGFTPDTGLYRDWPSWAKMAGVLARLIRPIARGNTPEAGGRSLAELALGNVTPPVDRVYASLNRRHLKWPDPSELARQDEPMRFLWDVSGRMLSLQVAPLPTHP